MFSVVYWNQHVCPSIRVSVCVQNTSFCQSAGRGINPFPNKPWFLCVCSISLLKTQWEKEKLLIRSNFSFSHSVFSLFVEFGKSPKFDFWKRVKLHLVTALVVFFTFSDESLQYSRHSCPFHYNAH